MKFIIATVKNSKGSTPREDGARMLISSDETLGTIGGGKLEFEVINTARELLANAGSSPVNSQKNYILGTQLGQCCGGQLSIDFQVTMDAGLWRDPLLENHQQFNIVLFGAGHVGQAIVSILATQPCQVHWIDSRAEIFPSPIPGNVVKYHSDDPASLIADMPEDSYYLVMTHDHGLDLDLCDHVLSRGDYRFLGLIGSQTKAERFKRQLLRRGLEQQDIDRMTCPIGIEGIRGKLPSSIALGVVAQLAGLEEARKAPSYSKDVKPLPSPPKPRLKSETREIKGGSLPPLRPDFPGERIASSLDKRCRKSLKSSSLPLLQRGKPYDNTLFLLEGTPLCKRGDGGDFSFTTLSTKTPNRSQNETHP